MPVTPEFFLWLLPLALVLRIISVVWPLVRIRFVLCCLFSAWLQVMLVEAQNSVRVNMGGYQSTRGPKRRKLNAVDVELDDRDIDLFLAQIVAILLAGWFPSCFCSFLVV